MPVVGGPIDTGIRRGKEAYLLHMLGAFGTDLWSFYISSGSGCDKVGRIGLKVELGKEFGLLRSFFSEEGD